MTEQEKIISEANTYVMPSVEDYLGTRCLLLNNIFVGLTLGHEAIEKLMKALLILENRKPPRSHNLEKLSELLLKKNSLKYVILNKQKEFIKRLDQHYGWRYYDGDITKRSKSKSMGDLQPLDNLWIALHEIYADFIPENSRYRTYLFAYLFDKNIAASLNWSEMLRENNSAIEDKHDAWGKEYEKNFGKNK